MDPAAAEPHQPLGLQRLTPAQQWQAGRRLRRLVQLVVGLSLFGVSMAMLVQGGLGMIPWDVLHFGVAQRSGLSFGTVVILVALVVLLLWIPLREMPGLGTVLNAVWVGVAADIALRIVPEQDAVSWQLVLLVAGIVLNAVATAMYIGAQFGPGPRDGLMTGLARILPFSLRVIRTCIEVTVVLIGWALGGVVGVGTVLFALSIGPLTQFFLPPFVVPLRRPETPAH